MAALKCPFLSKLTFNEIRSNASTIVKFADRCPYMPQFLRGLSDYKKPTTMPPPAQELCKFN